MEDSSLIPVKWNHLTKKIITLYNQIEDLKENLLQESQISILQSRLNINFINYLFKLSCNKKIINSVCFSILILKFIYSL